MKARAIKTGTKALIGGRIDGSNRIIFAGLYVRLAKSMTSAVDLKKNQILRQPLKLEKNKTLIVGQKAKA